MWLLRICCGLAKRAGWPAGRIIWSLTHWRWLAAPMPARIYCLPEGTNGSAGISWRIGWRGWPKSICGCEKTFYCEVPMPLDDILLDSEEHMEKAVDHLK